MTGRKGHGVPRDVLVFVVLSLFVVSLVVVLPLLLADPEKICDGGLTELLKWFLDLFRS